MIEALCLLLAVFLGGSPLQAQRSLHWRDVRVEARLDDDGTLHIVERQTIVFSGDWNGGARTFNIRRRQRLRFEGMRRIDDAGQAHVMREGGEQLAVDEYRFVDSKTLRWRSRNPSDPPFDDTPITYELSYVLANVLQREEDTWVLDHDFGFPDRDGVIENLSVTLADPGPSWRPIMAFDGSWSQHNVLPGEGFVVLVPLRYAGANAPADPGASPIVRVVLAVLALVVLAGMGRRLLAHERGQGRLDPLPPPDSVDAAWLQEHVFTHLPEVVGAAWDNRTNAAEVTAILARLVGEGRMRSEVRPGGFLKGPVLHLELLVDRDRFHDYERRLVDSLFEPGERTTDTERIRERYRKSGFDPASKVQKPLKNLVTGLVPGGTAHKPSALPTLIAFVGAIGLMILAVVREPADAPVVFLAGATILVCYFAAVGAAVAWRNRVHTVAGSALYFLVPSGIAVAIVVGLLGTGGMQASVMALAAVTLLMLALANSVFNQAQSRESVERIAFRRRLATARAFFLNELARQQPRLEDAWFPYLVAFGLAKHMDKWFEAFGGQQAAVVHSTLASSGSRGAGSSSGGGWTGFGGGGGFSGGGTSGSWVAAASSISAGVAAPSSSSGGSSGGGGGGSSGGGGGGGW